MTSRPAWQIGENSLFSRINNDSRSDELTVELALFVDDALWTHFQQLYDNSADLILRNYAFTVMNALFRHPSLKRSVQFVVNHYAVMKVPPVLEFLDSNYKRKRNINSLGILVTSQPAMSMNLLFSFKCDEKSLVLRRYDLYDNEVRTLAGYAPVKGMCAAEKSCTISEGVDFSAVFIVAHEMGHNMGMTHDGENGCNDSCCIMSTSTGPGRTLWSPCSARELDHFIAVSIECDEI
ncbi:unnamed protein product [Litomosoides sigmodontis]|uniref:Peptidase M12B domain-containing protein n=1 Tax=Litomosoides sigmodontis TaxID=42156 RepID=A0A3P6UYW6_LITSI|nr:unnamed protein product [Litomosoides sigmodontis]